MSKLAKEIAIWGVGTFAVLTVLFVIGQWLGASFSSDPQPIRVIGHVLDPQGENGHGEEAVTHVAANDTVANDAGDHANDAGNQEQTAAAPAVAQPVAQGEPAPTGIKYALGRPATPEEVVAWDIDVSPYDVGLPEGSGDVATGEEVFAEKCAVCHGDFGEGVGRWPVLAGGQGTLASANPVKTIGSYWPYLSTVFDYVHRAMPFGDARSLTPDEVYAITAYLLYVNDLVDDDFELSKENFGEIRLPNEPNFIDDDRPQVEYPVLRAGEVCMENCKDEVKITMRARVIDVTPEDTESRRRRAELYAPAGAEGLPVETAATETGSTETGTTETAAAATGDAGSGAAQSGESAPAAASAEAPDPALVAKGEKVFKKCKACHQVGEGAKNKTGPELNGLVGRKIASVEGFRYSNAMKAAGEEGRVWSEEELHAFLKDPKAAMPGTKMSFRGLKKDDDIDALIAYLKTFPAE